MNYFLQYVILSDKTSTYKHFYSSYYLNDPFSLSISMLSTEFLLVSGHMT